MRSPSRSKKAPARAATPPPRAPARTWSGSIVAVPAPGTRERVLDVTRALIAERGSAEISLVEVAASAGLSRQALYLLFGSRAGLLLALVEQLDAASDIPRRLASIRQELPAAEALEPYLRSWFEYLPVVLPVARALQAAATTGDADARAAWDSRMQKLRAGFLQLAKGLKAAGRLQDGWSAETAGEWMFAQTHVDMWQHLVVEGGWRPREAVARILGGLRATLLVPG